MADVQLEHGRCWYCGVQLGPRRMFRARGEYDPTEATWDHMVPRSRGGGNGPDNLVAACRRCNARKSTKTVDEFRQYMENNCPFKVALDALEVALDAIDSGEEAPEEAHAAAAWLRRKRSRVVFFGERAGGGRR